MKKSKPKVIVILGPTSSGKSDAAIRLAQKFNGEIISADSRQIYRGMDIGSGKVTLEEQAMVKHWMLDIVSPKTNYSAGQFKEKAERILKDIIKRRKLPIICGGTGFWIKALVDDVTYPEVKPDWELRKSLQKKSAEELFQELQELDSERAKNIDSKNKVRLIRAIEICKSLGNVPFVDSHSFVDSNRSYDFLQIGISIPKETLHERIKLRLDKRFKEGMIDEVRELHFEDKVSWKRLESFGLEYKWIAMFLQNKITEEEMKERLFQESKNYAKRQMTWFNKDKRIVWSEKYEDTEKEVEKFLKK